MKKDDNININAYQKEAAEKWGDTDAYREYTAKTKEFSENDYGNITEGLNNILSEFSVCMKKGNPALSDEAQGLVKKLQMYITDNLYTCTNEILSGLGQMYVYDNRFKANIDKHADGTADYINRAIKVYCTN